MPVLQIVDVEMTAAHDDDNDDDELPAPTTPPPRYAVIWTTPHTLKTQWAHFDNLAAANTERRKHGRNAFIVDLHKPRTTHHDHNIGDYEILRDRPVPLNTTKEQP